MRYMEVTDEWLYRYMPMADETMIRELEDSTDYTYQFSVRFERKMKRLIWREAHWWLDAGYRQLKRVALLGICVVASVLLLSLSVEGNRIKFFDTVSTMLESSVLYTYFTDEQEGEFQAREPGYLPEGYRETERSLSDIHMFLVFENEKGEMITWEQILVSSGASVGMDMEYDVRETKEVNGKSVVICSYFEGDKYAYCEYKESVFILTADNLPVDEICKMFMFTGYQ
ncbi:MAG: DUF4367 domain-containing protein [Lachnospiraceae bacterium]|nr:DUF4367 domain-containing protein [Lachnospiraceae bacterium]